MTLPEELILPPRTLTGAGTARRLLPECAAFGPRGLLVHGRALRREGVLPRLLAAAPDGLRVSAWEHPGGEPTLAQLEALLAHARRERPDWIAAVGGGSVMDVAKACAGLLDAPQPVQSYHDGAAIPPARVPFAAVPTTAGTGSESTIVCVLTNEEAGVKKSIRHPSFMARLVILDPDLLASCPPAVTAASGMDAFTQAVEAFTSRKTTWFSDALALKAAVLIAGSVEAVTGGAAGAPAADLLEGSYLAGLALSHARLGLVHGLAHPLGSRYHAPHGLVCAVCLPHVIAFNAEAARAKYAALGEALGAGPQDAARRLLRALRIVSPFAGQPSPDRAGIVSEALASGSTAANPRAVSAADIERILDALFAPPPR